MLTKTSSHKANAHIASVGGCSGYADTVGRTASKQSTAPYNSRTEITSKSPNGQIHVGSYSLIPSLSWALAMLWRFKSAEKRRGSMQVDITWS